MSGGGGQQLYNAVGDASSSMDDLLDVSKCHGAAGGHGPHSRVSLFVAFCLMVSARVLRAWQY